MRRTEIGMAMLTITCMAWARIHHWRAGRASEAPAGRICPLQAAGGSELPEWESPQRNTREGKSV